jgi:hypothetical protein
MYYPKWVPLKRSELIGVLKAYPRIAHFSDIDAAEGVLAQGEWVEEGNIGHEDRIGGHIYIEGT